MVIITKEYKFDSCKNCPFLKYRLTYDGMDGRTSCYTYVCDEGVFGSRDQFAGEMYWNGLREIPRVPPYTCPYIKSNKLSRLASKLNISNETLQNILNEEHIKLSEISNDKLKLYYCKKQTGEVFIVNAESQNDIFKLLQDVNILNNNDLEIKVIENITYPMVLKIVSKDWS